MNTQKREDEVLTGIANGMPLKAIAQKLGIGEKLADYYRQKAYRRFGVRCVAEATKCAIRIGLVTL